LTMSDDGSEINNEIAEEVTDLSNSDVCTKYQEASKIVNLALPVSYLSALLELKLSTFASLVQLSWMHSSQSFTTRRSTASLLRRALLSPFAFP